MDIRKPLSNRFDRYRFKNRYRLKNRYRFKTVTVSKTEQYLGHARVS